ncbi:MAG: glutamate-5-semialdehyde dehydrogenase [Thermoleophilia bacterium]|nr:glutamate-5-semialdehyde dehydrogenase [Thermoleophilia bacterium]
MTTTHASLDERLAAARAAARLLARITPGEKSDALEAVAKAILSRASEILAMNAEDVRDARQSGVPTATVDRLFLDEARLESMAAGILAVAALPDPVGVVTAGWRVPNGLEILETRVPLGVIGVIYEGRPNVTTDAAALALKSGNAIVLRGSRVAERSNEVLGDVVAAALAGAGLPDGAVTMLGTDRDEMLRLIQAEGKVDLVIPRGGEDLKAYLQQNARVPVIYAASGNCHVYVDADADLDDALGIAVNAKVQRPGVCNACETLLVHRDVAAEFLPRVAEALLAEGVELRVSDEARSHLDALAGDIAAVTEDDFATEFLDLIISVGVVGSVHEAVDHVNRFGSGHSEAIVTRSRAAAQAFQQGIDSAVVYVNASTRFTDGGEFGMGAEIGISTQKLHARGPIGLADLTTVKYLVTGTGQIR